MDKGAKRGPQINRATEKKTCQLRFEIKGIFLFHYCLWQLSLSTAYRLYPLYSYLSNSPFLIIPVPLFTFIGIHPISYPTYQLNKPPPPPPLSDIFYPRRHPYNLPVFPSRQSLTPLLSTYLSIDSLSDQPTAVQASD